MFFSVLIPVYNVEKYIHECVDSVLSQDEQDYEIILVDDGSTDTSGAICDAYALKYPEKIRVIHKQNEGLLLTRRRAIQEARGDWFVHLDSDDYMMPGALKAIRNAAETDETDLVICKIAYGAKDGKNIDFYSRLPFSDKQIFEGEEKQLLYRQLLFGGFMTAIFQKIARRDIVDIKTDYSKWPRVSLGEDALQSMPILQNCKRAVYLDLPIVYYRYNADSITKKKSAASYEASFWSLRDVYLEEQTYQEIWRIEKDDRRKIISKHLRSLYLKAEATLLVAKKSEIKTSKEYIGAISDDDFLRLEFREADKQVLGLKSRFFFYLAFRKLFYALRLYVKVTNYLGNKSTDLGRI